MPQRKRVEAFISVPFIKCGAVIFLPFDQGALVFVHGGAYGGTFMVEHSYLFRRVLDGTLDMNDMVVIWGPKTDLKSFFV